MTINLISTSDMLADRKEQLERLLRSVASNGSTCPEPIRLFVLLQNCTSAEAQQVRLTVPDFCTVFSTARRCSLSSARNQILQFLDAQGLLKQDDIVGFPDDDCWFPASFFSSLVDALAWRSDLNVLFCRCSLQPEEAAFTSDQIKQANLPQVVRLSSSNNVFYKGSIIKKIGSFDEHLGLGTPIGGSEDTDFALRAFLAAGIVGFIDRRMIGHPEPSRFYAAKYFRGSIIVLARYANCGLPHTLEFFRKICVGVVFTLYGKIGPNYFFKSLMLAAKHRSPVVRESSDVIDGAQLAR